MLLASFKGLKYADAERSAYDAFFKSPAVTAAMQNAAGTLPRDASFGSVPASVAAAATPSAAVAQQQISPRAARQMMSASPAPMPPSANSSVNVSTASTSATALPPATAAGAAGTAVPMTAGRSMSPGPARKVPSPQLKRVNQLAGGQLRRENSSPPTSPAVDNRAQSARAPRALPPQTVSRTPSNPSLTRVPPPDLAAASTAAAPAPSSSPPVGSSSPTTSSPKGSASPVLPHRLVSSPMLTPVSTAVAQPGGQVLSTGVSVLLHRLQYVPGDLVSGSVQLALKTARGVKELVVAFQGTDARTERGRTTTGLLFKVTKKLVASPTGVPKKMSGGVFTYPFSFSTRTDLPSTCFLSNPDGTSRRVLYELQAHLKLQRGKNRSVHQEIALAGKPTTMSTPTLTDVSLTDATDNGPAREAPRRPSDTPPSTVTPKSDAPTRRPSRNPPPPEPMLPAAVATPSPLSGAIASTATDAAAPGSPAVSRIRPALSRRQHLRADIRGGVASMSNSNLDPQAMVEIEAIHVQYDEQIQEVLDELMRRELLEVSARFDASLEAMRQVLNEKLAEAH